MKTLVKLSFASFLVLSLLSCDPHTCGTAYIENASSRTVYLEIDSLSADTLAAGRTKTIGPVCGLGMGLTPNVVHYYRRVRNDDTFCRKDILWDSTWTTIKSGKYKREHHFNLTDADF